MVRDGTRLELLEEADDYARVRLENGNEGWMLKRFLSAEPPIADRYLKLQEEFAAVEEDARQSETAIESLRTKLEEARKEIAGLMAERDEIKAEYQQILEETADVVKIKEDQEQTARENSSLSQQLAEVEQQNAAWSKDRTMYWFLAGAGVFLVGILFGKMPAPSRRRKSSLL
jgi:SH3 domain protein